jgi:hypothetical protein
MGTQGRTSHPAWPLHLNPTLTLPNRRRRSRGAGLSFPLATRQGHTDGRRGAPASLCRGIILQRGSRCTNAHSADRFAGLTDMKRVGTSGATANTPAGLPAVPLRRTASVPVITIDAARRELRLPTGGLRIPSRARLILVCLLAFRMRHQLMAEALCGDSRQPLPYGLVILAGGLESQPFIHANRRTVMLADVRHGVGCLPHRSRAGPHRAEHTGCPRDHKVPPPTQMLPRNSHGLSPNPTAGSTNRGKTP